MLPSFEISPVMCNQLRDFLMKLHEFGAALEGELDVVWCWARVRLCLASQWWRKWARRRGAPWRFGVVSALNPGRSLVLDVSLQLVPGEVHRCVAF